MKRIFFSCTAVFLAMFFALMIVPAAEASPNIQILKDGQPLTVESDSQPFIENGRTFVPLRLISEAYNCDVKWMPQSEYGDRTIFVTKTNDDGEISSYVFLVNVYHYLIVGPNGDAPGAGLTEIPIDAPPRIIAGRTFVPLRAVGELFGSVEWDPDNSAVLLGTAGTQAPVPTVTIPDGTQVPDIGGGSTSPYGYLTKSMQNQINSFGPLDTVKTTLIEPVFSGQTLFDAVCASPLSESYYNEKYQFRVIKPSIWGQAKTSEIYDGAIIYQKNGWDIRVYGISSLGKQPAEYFAEFYPGQSHELLGNIGAYPCYILRDGQDITSYYLFDTVNEQMIVFYIKTGTGSVLPEAFGVEQGRAYLQLIAEEVFWSYVETH